MTLSLAPAAQAARLMPNLGAMDQPAISDADSAADQGYQVAQEDQAPAANVAIQPSQAADIAQSVDPSARVIKVKLLPSGVYAVILKGDGKLTRVMVDAQTGNIL